MIWSVEYWYRVYHGGEDAGVRVVDSLHFDQQEALKRRDELEEEYPDRAILLHCYHASDGSRRIFDFEYPYPD